jgi:hypothetical protein
MFILIDPHVRQFSPGNQTVSKVEKINHGLLSWQTNVNSVFILVQSFGYRYRRESTAAAPPGFGPYVGELVVTSWWRIAPLAGWYWWRYAWNVWEGLDFDATQWGKHKLYSINRQQTIRMGWVREWGEDFRPTRPPGDRSGAELLKVRVDVPRALSNWSQASMHFSKRNLKLLLTFCNIFASMDVKACRI